MPNRTCIRCRTTFAAPNGHRGQWRRYCSQKCEQTPPPPRPLPACTVAGCAKPANRERRTICEMHYGRLRRSGTLEARPQRDKRGICTVDGCSNPDNGPRGLCSMHRTREDRHGDVNTTLPRPVTLAGESPSWKGDKITVKAAHMRIRAARGPAKGHLCVDCSAAAAHWSYDHTDPDEQQSDHGPYSPDIGHYQPRCVPCHKAFDLAHIATRHSSARSATP